MEYKLLDLEPHKQMIDDLYHSTKGIDEKLNQFLEIQMKINDLYNHDINVILEKYLQQQKVYKMFVKCLKRLWLAVACNTAIVILLVIIMILH